MEIKSIKGVDEVTWSRFKSLAAESNLTMSLLLKVMVNEFRKNNESSWDGLFGEARLSEEEAREMLSVSGKIRKEEGFRI